MKFALKDVLQNPNRDLTLNPLKDEKIEHLKESIEETGFWENIVVRKSSKNKAELGYGHHRYAALLDLFGKDYVTDFIVQDLSDDAMRQMMARENDETYRNDTVAVMESVQAAVRALAEGTVSPTRLLPPDPSTPVSHIRYAPSYIAGRDVGGSSPKVAYTTFSLARYLGYTMPRGGKTGEKADEKVTAALVALENMERGLWNKKTIQTFRREEDGPILADRVIRAGRDSQLKADHIRQNEEAKAETQRQKGLSIQQRINEENAEKKRIAAEADKLHKERMAATAKEDADRVALKLEEEKQNKLAAEAAEKRRQELEKEFSANQKERANSLAAQRKAKEDVIKKIEASRASQVTTIIGKFERLFADDDFSDTIVMLRKMLVKPDERAKLKTTLKAAKDRISDAANRI